MPRINGKITWRTQDGREMEIADMDNRHILNVLNLLERRAGINRFNYPDKFTKYETVETLAAHLYPEYRAIADEARKRKLIN